MNRPVDCSAFQDQLDALSGGKLPDAGAEQLRRHAASCAECATLLRMHEHLASRSVDELERAVPDDLLGSVWPRLQADLGGRRSPSAPAPKRWQRWNWSVPVLAAATLSLFVASGLLYREVRQLHQREALLIQQVAEQGRRLTELDLETSMDPVARVARLAGRGAWERALARRSSVSVSELEAMLRRLPVGATLLTADESEAVAQSLPLSSSNLAAVAFADIESEDGVQAGELLHLLGALDIDPERRIPTARILAIARRTGRLGRS